MIAEIPAPTNGYIGTLDRSAQRRAVQWSRAPKGKLYDDSGSTVGGVGRRQWKRIVVNKAVESEAPQETGLAFMRDCRDRSSG